MTEELTLPIRIGKRYVRRDGVTVTAQEPHTQWRHRFIFVGEGKPKSDNSLHAFRATGRLYTLIDHPHDLIADAPAEVEDEVEDEAEVEDADGPHPHAASMLLYAQDAAETRKPWRRWQRRMRPEDDWSAIGGPVMYWIDGFEYRRTPATTNIQVGDRVTNAPLRVAPEIGAVYWVSTPSDLMKAYCCYWADDAYDRLCLAHGNVFATEADAIACTDALIAMLENKP